MAACLVCVKQHHWFVIPAREAHVRRHDDIASSNYAFYRGIGAEIGLTDPVFRKKIKEQGLDADKVEDMPKIGELWIEWVSPFPFAKR